jgi:hypothetical protein
LVKRRSSRSYKIFQLGGLTSSVYSFTNMFSRDCIVLIKVPVIICSRFLLFIWKYCSKMATAFPSGLYKVFSKCLQPVPAVTYKSQQQVNALSSKCQKISQSCCTWKNFSASFSSRLQNFLEKKTTHVPSISSCCEIICSRCGALQRIMFQTCIVFKIGLIFDTFRPSPEGVSAQGIPLSPPPPSRISCFRTAEAFTAPTMQPSAVSHSM